MATKLATLEEIGAALADGGFNVSIRPFRTADEAVIAESPYAVVGCIESNDWATLRRYVEDFQAELTQLSSRPPSVRRWDLYIVVHVLSRAKGPVDEYLLEAIEADTHYARKFVRVALPQGDRGVLERALRPLLPLRDVPQFDRFDPLVALREELRQLDVPDSVADAALASFAQTDDVTVP